MMDAAALGAVLRLARHDLFRLELLDYYEPDEAEFRRYLAGEEPDDAQVRPWLERLRAEQARGLQRRRVHVLRSPIGAYLRYEAEWAYVRNAHAGEEIRILDLAERPCADVPAHDFWLIDRQEVVVMDYEDGVFTSASTVPPSMPHTAGYYRRAASEIWDAAEPFSSWWNRHREYHRGQSAA